MLKQLVLWMSASLYCYKRRRRTIVSLFARLHFTSRLHFLKTNFTSNFASFSLCNNYKTVCNSPLSFVRNADRFTSFRSQLKTYMFTRHWIL